jgi:nucleotide-binding universal stress UspA family protein
MFKSVLLCYDGSHVGRRALRRGADLAILLKAQVHVLAIVPSGVSDPDLLAGSVGYPCFVDNQASVHEKMLDESIRWLEARGVAALGHLAGGDAVEQIIAYSKRLAIELIVLGHYPQPSGGFWWSGLRRISLAERTRCCIFVAVDGPDESPSQ